MMLWGVLSQRSGSDRKELKKAASTLDKTSNDLRQELAMQKVHKAQVRGSKQASSTRLIIARLIG